MIEKMTLAGELKKASFEVPAFINYKMDKDGHVKWLRTKVISLSALKKILEKRFSEQNKKINFHQENDWLPVDEVYEWIQAISEVENEKGD